MIFSKFAVDTRHYRHQRCITCMHFVGCFQKEKEEALIGEYSFHFENNRFGAKNQFPDQEREE